MFQPGEVIDDRYDVLGPLGQGGMAHVFRAHDRRLERTVALKVLRPHLTETDAERFRREIRALARFNHPGIVAIYDLGQGEHVYFAMELVEGGPITDLGPFDGDPEALDALLGAAITVADALDYVHRLGMVHRDLTPRNILLTRSGHPKVMDFGLVRLTESSRELTRTGFTLGTPQYMAPEQATGGAPIGASADLYAFGAVLYRTLAGRAPFDADNDQAVLYQHVYGDLVSVAELAPQAPGALSRLIDAMLSKRPEERPASAGSIAAALQSLRATLGARASEVPRAGPGMRGSYPSGPVVTQGLRVRWQRTLDEGPQWPAGLGAAAGWIAVAQRSDQLALLHPSDGSISARFPLTDEVATAPVYAGDRLYVASRDGAVSALAWPQGTVLWNRDDVDVVGLSGYGLDLVVATREGRLERWDRHGGTRWRFDAGTPLTTPACLHRAQAYAFDESGWLHAVDVTSGARRFKVEVGASVAAPVAVDGVLLLTARAGELHAFDVETHEVRWSYDLEGEVWAAPAVAGAHVFVASWGERLHALTLKSGDDIWDRSLGAPLTAAPVVAAGVVYAATEAGELLGFDAAGGRPTVRHQVTHGPIQASPLPIGDAVVVAAIDGSVHCLE